MPERRQQNSHKKSICIHLFVTIEVGLVCFQVVAVNERRIIT